ncbi:uncharacterized protein LOC144106666 [Amblyomma americanum]
MAATPTTTSCWGCFRWRQLQQERSSRESTLSFRPSHGLSYNHHPQQPGQPLPHHGGGLQPGHPFAAERPQLEQPTSHTPGPSQPGSVHRLSFPPSGIERHLARLHSTTSTDNRKSFPPCQVSDTDSGLGRTITAETSEESFAGAVAGPQAPPTHRLCGGSVCNGIYRGNGAVSNPPGAASLGGGPENVLDDGLAHEMALLRVELEIVRWECESIIRQKRRRDQDLLGSWSRRRRVLDWMQRHDSSDTSYDPSTLSSNSEDRREASPSPTSSVEALCSRTPPPSCVSAADSSAMEHIYEAVARSPSPMSAALGTSSPHVRSQSMTLNNNPPTSGPPGRVLSPEHKRCSSASPVRRKLQNAALPAVLSPVRTYRFSCTINETPPAGASRGTRSPSCSPVRHSAASFRPRCSSNPVPHSVTPAAVPIVTSRTAGQISDLYRRQDHITSCFPTQSIPESPLALHSTSSSPIPVIYDRSPASPVRFQDGGAVSSPSGLRHPRPLNEDKPRRWFDGILQDSSASYQHEPSQLCSFYSPQRQNPKGGRLQPVFEAECYGGPRGGILDLDLEFVTKEYEIFPADDSAACRDDGNAAAGGGAAQRPKKTRRQMRKERAMQIARTRADTTTSTDSDATLKHHHSGCHACARSRKKGASQAHRSPSKQDTTATAAQSRKPMHRDGSLVGATDYML